jgi:hypothetical protein
VYVLYSSYIRAYIYLWIHRIMFGYVGFALGYTSHILTCIRIAFLNNAGTTQMRCLSAAGVCFPRNISQLSGETNSFSVARRFFIYLFVGSTRINVTPSSTGHH